MKGNHLDTFVTCRIYAVLRLWGKGLRTSIAMIITYCLRNLQLCAVPRICSLDAPAAWDEFVEFAGVLFRYFNDCTIKRNLLKSIHIERRSDFT